MAATSFPRGRKTWPLFSLWLSSKLTAAWSLAPLSGSKPMLMAIPSATEKATPHSSLASR